ncbi:hypothetical protein T492DRAFT_429210, partial [Pavlovales sp. CCMP2436]
LVGLLARLLLLLLVAVAIGHAIGNPLVVVLECERLRKIRMSSFITAGDGGGWSLSLFSSNQNSHRVCSSRRERYYVRDVHLGGAELVVGGFEQHDVALDAGFERALGQHVAVHIALGAILADRLHVERTDGAAHRRRAAEEFANLAVIHDLLPHGAVGAQHDDLYLGDRFLHSFADLRGDGEAIKRVRGHFAALLAWRHD